MKSGREELSVHEEEAEEEEEMGIIEKKTVEQ